MRSLIAVLSVVLSGVAGTAWAEPPRGSVLHFDAKHPDVRAYTASQGLHAPGHKTTLLDGELHYTKDNWTTTHKAPLQYLHDGHQGFILPHVEPGTPIEYAVHAKVGVSLDHFRSTKAVGDLWVNNGGANHRTVTETPK